MGWKRLPLFTHPRPSSPRGGASLNCYLIPLLIITLMLYLGSCSQEGNYNGLVSDESPENFCLKGWNGRSEREVCLSDLKGRAVVLFFGYTRCPDVCPRTMDLLSRTFRGIPEDMRDGVAVLFISLDPERDSPRHVQRYAGFFGEGFVGLTGGVEEVGRVARKFGVLYEKEGSGGSYTINHTALIYLISPDGERMLVYPIAKQKPELIRADIEKLILGGDRYE
ncbi:SCO family protein [Hydrogenivirga sp. 128-5-R1-1]|uniref:SCO family protein n=1 Tax=Hydrogenivirga sp. 128-5-R1-1 TaxID=392423 RepID=UPI00015F364E|nr:SCO family protein [Hydrogenivirga sp. 128-5-R1-1]EDP76649.1 hypothetical protein HG1285_03543 [Hydrogenivirga sp. 128-5-R1-1]